MKIKYLILFFIISVLCLVNVSCPSELIKGTVWEGTLKLKDEFDIEANFYNNNVIHLYKKDKNFDKSTLYKGSYSLNNDTNSIVAKLEAGFLIDGDDIKDKSKVKIEGELNFYNGVGSGDCEVNEYLSSLPDEHFEGTWELQKVK